MTTIQLNIPNELAERLDPYRDQLADLLELGLQKWLERERQQRLSQRDQLLQTLASSGKVKLPHAYPVEKPYSRQTPITIKGKPVSEILIEQRGPLL